MRVLFVPLHDGGLPHCGPLIALARLCAAAHIDSAFLLPKRDHGIRLAAGIDVLDVDYQNTLRSELEAYRRYRPDVVVDDCSVTTLYASAVAGTPRVSLVRTGTFAGYVPQRAHHRFSLMVNVDRQETAFGEAMNLGIRQVADYFRGDLHVVPGIAAIERLPEACAGRGDHVYAGPLLLDDDCVARIVQATKGRAIDRRGIAQFCAEQAGKRPLAFFTFGNIHAPTPESRECIRRLVARDVAVVSTILLEPETAAEKALYRHASYVPMHDVCGRAQLMVHQCGSATYHYGLAHAVPTLTVGSRCFDRDDVAERLEALGVSRHVEDPADEPRFVDRFLELAALALADAEREARLARVRALEVEIQRTRNAFSIGETLAAAIARRKQASRPPVNARARRA